MASQLRPSPLLHVGRQRFELVGGIGARDVSAFAARRHEEPFYHLAEGEALGLRGIQLLANRSQRPGEQSISLAVAAPALCFPAEIVKHEAREERFAPQ